MSPLIAGGIALAAGVAGLLVWVLAGALTPHPNQPTTADAHRQAREAVRTADAVVGAYEEVCRGRV